MRRKQGFPVWSDARPFGRRLAQDPHPGRMGRATRTEGGYFKLEEDVREELWAAPGRIQEGDERNDR